MSDPSARPSGILASLRRVIEGGLGLVQNRVELIGLELREAHYRLIEAIILAAILFALGLLTIGLVTLLVVVLFWDSARLAAIGGLIGLYAISGLLVWRHLDRRWKAFQPFAGTLGELKKDRACLRAEP